MLVEVLQLRIVVDAQPGLMNQKRTASGKRTSLGQSAVEELRKDAPCGTAGKGKSRGRGNGRGAIFCSGDLLVCQVQIVAKVDPCRHGARYEPRTRDAE